MEVWMSGVIGGYYAIKRMSEQCKWTNKWVAQYLRLDFWLIWTIVDGNVDVRGDWRLQCKQANEWAVQANKQMDKWVAQYLHLDF